jgi:hypothetical protein
MNIEDEIMLNKYGQELLEDEFLLHKFKTLNTEEKREFLNGLTYLIIQSKANNNDIDEAIYNSELKSTFTPCVLIKKGVTKHVLYKIIDLPENELEKAFLLFINLFKIAYKRRYQAEKDEFTKWWYWDLSDENNVQEIRRMFRKTGPKV